MRLRNYSKKELKRDIIEKVIKKTFVKPSITKVLPDWLHEDSIRPVIKPYVDDVVAILTRDISDIPAQMTLKNTDTNKIIKKAITMIFTEAVIKSLIINQLTTIKETNGKTPLHRAAQYYPDCIPGILAQGIDRKIKDETGRTAYEYFIHDKTYLCLNDIQIAMRLIECGVNQNAMNAHGDTLLHFAARGNSSLMSQLLTIGIDPAIKNKFGRTAFHCLINKYPLNGRDIGIAMMMMKRTNVLLNTCNDNGQSLLHLAVISDKFNLIPELIKLGVNIRIKDSEGHTVYDYLINPTYMTFDSFQAAVSLFEAGSDPNMVNAKHQTLLHIAAINNPSVIPKLLCYIDPTIEDINGRNALFYLITKKHNVSDKINFLIENINTTTDTNKWHNANQNFIKNKYLLSKRIQAAIALIKSGIDPNTANEKGETVLHIAINRPSFIPTLINLGAKLEIKNNKNQSPLDLLFGELNKFLVLHMVATMSAIDLIFSNFDKSTKMVLAKILEEKIPDIFSRIAKREPNAISGLLQQKIFNPTIKELTSALNNITLRSDFNFDVVLDLLLRGAKPEKRDGNTLIDLAVTRNKLEYIFKLVGFVYEFKEDSLKILINRLYTANSISFFPIAQALLILLEISPREKEDDKKIKKVYLKHVLSIIFHFPECQELKSYVKNLFYQNSYAPDILKSFMIEKKLHKPEKLFQLISNANLRLEIKYASPHHKIRNTILNLFLLDAKNRRNNTINWLSCLPPELFLYIVTLSFDLAAANITLSDLRDLWLFLKNNAEVEEMEHYPLTKKIGISVLQRRQNNKNTFFLFHSAENYAWYYQSKKDEMQGIQSHHQTSFFDRKTREDLLTKTNSKLDKIRAQAFSIFNKHTTIFQDPLSVKQLELGLANTSIYKKTN